MTEPAVFASWRDAVTALRHRDQCLRATLTIVAATEVYLLCLVVAVLAATAAYAWAVQPALDALFGRVPNPPAVQLAVGAAGAPLFWANVRLVNRVAGRLLPDTAEMEGNDDG